MLKIIIRVDNIIMLHARMLVAIACAVHDIVCVYTGANNVYVW